MERLFILVICSFTFLFIACDKDRNFTVIEGTVLEFGSLDPIQGASVEIYQGYSKGLFQGFVEWPMDTVYTDAEGKFKFRTEIDPYNKEYDSPGSFNINKIWHQDYYPEDAINNQFTGVFHLEKEYFEAQLDPHAWIQFHLIDVPEIESDYCIVGGDYLDTETIPLGEDKLLSPNLTRGNRYIKIYTKFYDGGPVMIDSTYVGALDTILYVVKY